MPPNQLVVYQRQPGKKKGKRKARRPVPFVARPRRKKQRPRPKRMNGAGSAIKQYQYALKYPFSPDALGARVVDAVCYPTTVSHIRYKTTCTTTATGTFQIVLLPFLHASSILVAGSTSGSPGAYANNTSVSYSILPTTLKNSFTSYRVVTWGVRVILTDSNLNARGTYTVAPILLGSNVPGVASLGVAASGVPAILNAFGVPTPSESIAGMPSAIAVNAQDLMANGELVMRGLVSAPTAYDMKVVTNDSGAWVGASAFSSSGAIFTNAGAVTTYETSNVNDARGQVAYLLSVANAPASTAEFQLEFIYHLEAVPQPATSIVMTSSPSPAGSTALIERVLAAMHTAGDYYAMGSNVARMVGSLGTRMYRFNDRRRAIEVD